MIGTGRLVLGALVVMFALPVSSAFAGAPDRDVYTVDDTFSPPALSAACGFEVTRHVEGTLTVHTFYDVEGNFVRELDSYHLTETLSANGQTLVGRTVQNILVTLYSDGSFAVAFMGADFRLSVPGAGISFGSVGRFMLLFDSNGDVQVVQDVGDARANYDAICAALTAA
jgi:hypothetical protein